MVRWVSDAMARQRGYNEAQRARVESVGVLAASGMIAGEALMGLVIAWFNYKDIKVPQMMANPSYMVGLVALAVLALVLVQVPLKNAGRPEDPAPPAVIV
jgi:hypothetical protein